uniref:Uncharacterized protein n=1 Tax=Anguilla anguilla TaxID=7936 RepID=A0A0E9W9Q1_ANGAN
MRDSLKTCEPCPVSLCCPESWAPLNLSQVHSHGKVDKYHKYKIYKVKRNRNK